jgi:Sec7-like guanine-nucleotide exchange factor
VKLTRALVRDLDEAIKEVNLLEEHEEESSQKITELEALCKRLWEDAHKLREEKTIVEGMIQSRDELILETTIAPINCLWSCGSFSLSCLREIRLSLLKAILLQ